MYKIKTIVKIILSILESKIYFSLLILTLAIKISFPIARMQKRQAREERNEPGVLKTGQQFTNLSLLGLTAKIKV